MNEIENPYVEVNRGDVLRYRDSQSICEVKSDSFRKSCAAFSLRTTNHWIFNRTNPLEQLPFKSFTC